METREGIMETADGMRGVTRRWLNPSCLHGVELGDEVTLRGASARQNTDAKSAPISLPVVEKISPGRKVPC